MNTRRKSKTIDGILHFRCTGCSAWTPHSKLEKNYRSGNNLGSRCMDCVKKVWRLNNEKQRAKTIAAKSKRPKKVFFLGGKPVCEKPSEDQIKAWLEQQRQKRTQKPVERVLQTPERRDSPKPQKRRKWPVKRKRKAIRQVSQTRKTWLEAYRQKHQEDPDVLVGYGLEWVNGEPQIIRVHGMKHCFERHHVGRRHRWLMLWYRYVTPELHTWIESNSATAREIGLLFNVECGQLRNPSPHDPLNCLEEFHELQSKYMLSMGKHIPND